MFTKGSICLKTYKDEVQKNNNFSKTKKKILNPPDHKKIKKITLNLKRRHIS